MDKSKQSTISMAVFVAMLVAFFSFFMPFVEAKTMYMKISSTGFQCLQDSGSEFLYLALGATIVGAIAAWICFSGTAKLIVPLIASIVGAVSTWSCFSKESMDFVAIGFWLFVLSHIVSAGLAIYSLLSGSASSSTSSGNTNITSGNDGIGRLNLDDHQKSSNIGAVDSDSGRWNLDGYVMKTPGKPNYGNPKTSSATPARWTCPYCNAANPMAKTLCRSCGKSLASAVQEGLTNTQSSVPPSRTQATESNQSEQPVTAWFCPSCGAKNEHSEPFCFNCGFKYVR